MRKVLFFGLVMGTIIISGGCDLLNNIIPDINTSLSETFQIQILTNVAESDFKMVDVTTADNYKNFKDHINGYQLDSMNYEVRNYNAPDDLYFSGEVICFNEERTDTAIIGNMVNAPMAAIADSKQSYPVEINSDNTSKVLSWLNDPGDFWLQTSYSFVNSDGKKYKFDHSGYNFQLIVHFYVTVKTSA